MFYEFLFRPVSIVSTLEYLGVNARAYVFDLFYCKVGVSGNAYGLRSDVDDDHDRSCNESFKEVIYFLI